MKGKQIASISVDEKEMERAARLLSGIPDGVERACLNAMNRALLEGRTAGTKTVRKEYAIHAADVRKSFAMHRASRKNLSAELVSRGRYLPLSKFRYKPTSDTTGNKRKQVRVAVKNTGFKPLGQAFIWGGKVMQRVETVSYNVRQAHTVSVPQMMDNPEVSEAVKETMNAAIGKRLNHEIDRMLKGYEGEAVWR